MEFDIINEKCSEAIKNFKLASTIIDTGNPNSLYIALANQLKELCLRFSDQKLTIFVAGEVKTGKSTLINSLLGIDILPATEEVCTNVPIKLVYGEKEKIIVHFIPTEGNNRDPLEIERATLKSYCSESENSENQNGVEYIEIQINSTLLALGLTFIDTPGLGAIDPLHALVTYRAATKADIIFFLSDVHKPLTESEVSSLKNLIKVSKTEQIVNLLTLCDLKDPSEVIAANKKIFDEEFSKYDIRTIKVSSLLYQKYVRSGSRNLLDVSGFQHVKTYLSEINSDLQTLLNNRFQNFAYAICSTGLANLTEILKTVEDPTEKEKIETELKDLLDRIKEIEEKKPIWSQLLTSQQEQLNFKLAEYIDLQEKTIKNNVSEKINNDYYFNNTDALTNCVSADLISFQDSLKEKIHDGFAEIYEWLRDTTGLKKIQEQNIFSPNLTPVNVKIDKESTKIKIGEKIRDIYIAVSIGAVVGGAASSAGVWAGGAAGAKIGAMIGTSMAPGLGSAIGAFVGGIAGVVTGVFSGWKVFKGANENRVKKQKKELETLYFTQIKNSFQEIRKCVKEVNIPNSTVLKVKFLEEVSSEKNRIKDKYDTIRKDTARIRQNYTNITKLKENTEKICSALIEHEA